MAMVKMAPRSSITAKAVRNTFKASGTRLPNKERMPMAKAMSVAMGMPAPEAVGVPWLKSKWMPAGTSMPPKAAMAGSRACLRSESSPMYTSRSSSRPTIRKKTAINPSLIQYSTVAPAKGACHRPA